MQPHDEVGALKVVGRKARFQSQNNEPAQQQELQLRGNERARHGLQNLFSEPGNRVPVAATDATASLETYLLILRDGSLAWRKQQQQTSKIANMVGGGKD
eukprot:7414048-Pyramimonas_sp.AAC.1